MPIEPQRSRRAPLRPRGPRSPLRYRQNRDRPAVSFSHFAIKAARGHATTAPPRNVMNRRRLMGSSNFRRREAVILPDRVVQHGQSVAGGGQLCRRRLYRRSFENERQNNAQQTDANQSADLTKPAIPERGTALNAPAETCALTYEARRNVSSMPLCLARCRPNSTNCSCSRKTLLESARFSPRFRRNHA